MLNVVRVNAIVFSVIFMNVVRVYAIGYSVILLGVVTMNAIYAECHYIKCHKNAEYRKAKCCYFECHTAESNLKMNVFWLNVRMLSGVVLC
jgi:hypothetical protein